MKNILVAIAICWINLGLKALAQHKNSMNDLFKVHSAVLNSLDESNYRYNIAEETNKTYLRYFDFTNNSKLNDNKEDILNKPYWQSFIKGIDTVKIENYQLSKDENFWSKYNKQKEGRYPNIIFAPVIFSFDKKKALCIFHKFQSGNSGSYMAAYIELNNGKWEVRKFETLVYLD